MTSPPTGSPANQLPSDEPPFAGKRFLMVEDEYLIALDIQQVLESAGAVATCVGSARFS